MTKQNEITLSATTGNDIEVNLANIYTEYEMVKKKTLDGLWKNIKIFVCVRLMRREQAGCRRLRRCSLTSRDYTPEHKPTHAHIRTHNNGGHAPSLRSLLYCCPHSSTFSFLLNVPLWSSMLPPAGQLTQWQALPKDDAGWLNSQQPVKAPSVHPCGTCFPVNGLQMEVLWVWKPLQLCSFKFTVVMFNPCELLTNPSLNVSHGLISTLNCCLNNVTLVLTI